MARYLALASFNETGAKALLDQGFAARARQFAEIVEGTGNSLEGYWFTPDGRTAAIVDVDDDTMLMSAVQGLASGTWLGAAEIIRISTGEELDAAAAKAAQYVPPGR